MALPYNAHLYARPTREAFLVSSHFGTFTPFIYRSGRESPSQRIEQHELQEPDSGRKLGSIEPFE